jgi:uncharacterized protein (TIGR00297 family)
MDGREDRLASGGFPGIAGTGCGYDETVAQAKLVWQSKLVLLIVLPFAAAGLVFEVQWWTAESLPVAEWSCGLSMLLALVVLQLRAATPTGALTGAVITASLMFSTVTFPYDPWHTALMPVLGVSLLAWSATKVGRKKKEALGTSESRRGRSASQVAANLGMAALTCSEVVQSWLMDSGWASSGHAAGTSGFALGLAALAEAAADTVSSEIGQVLGGRPRMITTLRVVDAGTDGGVTLMGTCAGGIAGAIVAGIGTLALRGGLELFWISGLGAVFGLVFDSLLGATLERRGWLNNDGVNFLSTASAAGFALGMLAMVSRLGRH